MLKFIAKLILIPVLSGLISLIYWKLVIYHGFPMINIFSREFDGENAYNLDSRQRITRNVIAAA